MRQRFALGDQARMAVRFLPLVPVERMPHSQRIALPAPLGGLKFTRSTNRG